MTENPKLMMKTVMSLTIGVYDDNGQVESAVLNSESPPRRLGYDQPIISNIPVGSYTDIYFSKVFDYTWGILCASLNGVPAKFQIYDGSGNPQLRGSTGLEFALVVATDNYAYNSPFNRPTHKNWYLRITNLSATDTLKAQAVIMGGLFSAYYAGL